MSIRVLIADDQPLIRSGLRLILQDQPDITVIAVAANGPDAIHLAARTCAWWTFGCRARTASR